MSDHPHFSLIAFDETRSLTSFVLPFSKEVSPPGISSPPVRPRRISTNWRFAAVFAAVASLTESAPPWYISYDS